MRRSMMTAGGVSGPPGPAFGTYQFVAGTATDGNWFDAICTGVGVDMFQFNPDSFGTPVMGTLYNRSVRGVQTLSGGYWAFVYLDGTELPPTGLTLTLYNSVGAVFLSVPLLDWTTNTYTPNVVQSYYYAVGGDVPQTVAGQTYYAKLE